MKRFAWIFILTALFAVSASAHIPAPESERFVQEETPSFDDRFECDLGVRYPSVSWTTVDWIRLRTPRRYPQKVYVPGIGSRWVICQNNPVNRIDPDGRIDIRTKEEKELMGQKDVRDGISRIISNMKLGDDLVRRYEYGFMVGIPCKSYNFLPENLDDLEGKSPKFTKSFIAKQKQSWAQSGIVDGKPPGVFPLNFQKAKVYNEGVSTSFLFWDSPVALRENKLTGKWFVDGFDKYLLYTSFHGHCGQGLFFHPDTHEQDYYRGNKPSKKDRNNVEKFYHPYSYIVWGNQAIIRFGEKKSDYEIILDGPEFQAYLNGK